MTNEELYKAFEVCAEAIRKQPANISAYVGAARIAVRLGKWDEAAHLAKSAIVRAPKDFTPETQKMLGTAHRTLGDNAQRKGNFREATSRYNTAIMYDPTNPDTLSSMALLEDKVGNVSAAIKFYEKAYEMDKADPVIQFNLGTKKLATGNFSDGWPLYRARHEMLKQQGTTREYHVPWLQSALQIQGKVFLWADQGIGDQILFSKFLHDIYDLDNAEITLEVSTPLVPAFRRSFPFLKNVVAHEEKLDPSFMKQFDAHMNMQDAASSFINSFDSIDTACAAGLNNYGWLKADPVRTMNLKNSMPGDSRLKVGLSWASPRSKDSLKKGMNIDQLRELMYLDGVWPVSLQYGLTQENLVYINGNKKYPLLSVWSAQMDDDVEGLIAKIACCDVVVTISNATAHIAGALGIPTILMVPVGYGCHWHWFYERTDCPWYSSVSLVRQKKVGEWEPVIKEVVDNIKTVVQQLGSRAA